MIERIVIDFRARQVFRIMSQQDVDQNNNLSTETDLLNVDDYQLDDDERRRLLDHVERVRAGAVMIFATTL